MPWPHPVLGLTVVFGRDLGSDALPPPLKCMSYLMYRVPGPSAKIFLYPHTGSSVHIIYIERIWGTLNPSYILYGEKTLCDCPRLHDKTNHIIIVLDDNLPK